MVSAWRNFKKKFPRPLYIIIIRNAKISPIFHFEREHRVEFVIYSVLKAILGLYLNLVVKVKNDLFPKL